jgi:hypothetical protein
MAQQLLTEVQQFALVDGATLSRAANILVAEQVARLPFARARGRLYVLVEPLGDRSGWEPVCRELVQLIHDEYYDSSGSVTAGLRKALEAANALLRDMNAAEARRSPKLAGVTAVVLRGSEAFLAQTGPALAYLVRAGSVTRFPEDSPWLDMSPQEAIEEGYAPPLGLREDLSVDLFHLRLEPGDCLVLAESAVAGVWKEKDIASLPLAEPQLLRARLLAALGDRDLSLLIVHFREQMPEWESDEEHGKPLAALVRRRDRAEDASHRGGMEEEVEARDQGATLAAWLMLVAEKVGGFAIEAGRRLWRRALPGSERARVARERRRRLRSVGRLPGAEDVERRDKAILLGIIVFLLVAGMAVFSAASYQRSRFRAAQLDATILQLQNLLQASAAADDPGVARQALQQAEANLTRLSELGASSEELQDLTRQLDEQWDRVDKVLRLYWLPLVREYREPGSSPARVVSHGIDIYVLDTGLGRVYKYLFTPLMDGLQELGPEIPEIIMRTGDHRDSLTLGRLTEMVWMPSGPGREWASLLVLEESGALIEYEPSTGIRTWAQTPLRALAQPLLLAGYEGRLVVLDRKGQRLLVYEPTGGAYQSEPVQYTSSQLMLGGVVDMAVDGEVYLLYADGLMVKLRGGEPQAFKLESIQPRIKQPVALCVTPATAQSPGHVYVADAGNQRILQFRKDGTFVRQFRPKRGSDAFRELRSVYVNEAAQKMLILTAEGLYIANIPAE